MPRTYSILDLFTLAAKLLAPFADPLRAEFAARPTPAPEPTDLPPQRVEAPPTTPEAPPTTPAPAEADDVPVAEPVVIFTRVPAEVPALMKTMGVRIEADCPEVFEIVDRAEALGVKSCTALPVRPGYPGAIGAVWLSDWVDDAHPHELTAKMREAIGDTPHRVTVGLWAERGGEVLRKDDDPPADAQADPAAEPLFVRKPAGKKWRYVVAPPNARGTTFRRLARGKRTVYEPCH